MTASIQKVSKTILKILFHLNNTVVKKVSTPPSISNSSSPQSKSLGEPFQKCQLQLVTLLLSIAFFVL